MKNPFLYYTIGTFIFISVFGMLVPLHVLAQDENKIPYDVTIQGLENDQLLNLIRKVSETVTHQDEPPVTEGLLRRRVRNDMPIINKALRSKGYYGARVETDVNTSIRPARVVFQIETGPVYQLKDVGMEWVAPPEQKKPKIPTPKELDLEPGRPAEAGPILEARNALLDVLRNQGFPLAEVPKPKVIVDHADKILLVTYSINSGPFALFGLTEIEGAGSVDPSFIGEQLPWRPGEMYQIHLLEEARTNLFETGLFNMVIFHTGNRLDAQGRIPITLQLSEREPRTLKIGLGYDTDEDVVGKIGWERRNLFHHGESLSFQGRGSGIGLTLEGNFEKPSFLQPDQSLIFNLRLADEYPKAYESRNINGLTQVKRKLDKGLDLALGIGFLFSQVEQSGEEDHYQLLSLPMAFYWDRRHDILDPMDGGGLGLRVTPYYDYMKEDTYFIKSILQYQHYFRLFSEPRVVFAVRTTLGSISGTDLEAIPADLRFYAGGGDSIRGYPYQSVGAVSGASTPIGGRSLWTLSSEFRIKITDKIGMVPFLDGGNIFRSKYPEFDKDLFWGAGLGLRYSTPIGPLRFDVAFPLNRRETDDAFRFYISLGQAF
ncbi:MAG: outer membrane protein assembly factor [Deltaproteobacteria bacterium]|nr:outer membrane protein assembly factor [Deltaproteobacteria bacterium]